MNIAEAIILGVIQGLTEFLPISSTAHLLAARQFMGHEQPQDAFTTVIQLGTLVAVLIYFRVDLVKIGVGWFRGLFTFKPFATPEARMGWLMILGTIPVVVIGLALKKHIKTHLYNLPVAAGAAIGFGLLLWEAEHLAKRREGRGEETTTWKDALIVGFFQALALIPGASRSGTTITAGLFAGLSRPAAARFSFLLSIPAIFGAGIYEAYKDRNEILKSEEDISALIVGLVTAGIVGYGAIHFLLGYLKKYGTEIFVFYRLAIGTLILVLIGMGVLNG